MICDNIMNTAKKIQNEKQIFSSENSASDAFLKDNVKCFDCGCKITLNEDEIENGSLLSYREENEDIFIFKCDDCLKKNKEISDYKECEIYTRIVGYLRPVNQYNPGKQQEYKERVEYKLDN